MFIKQFVYLSRNYIFIYYPDIFKGTRTMETIKINKFRKIQNKVKS